VRASIVFLAPGGPRIEGSLYRRSRLGSQRRDQSRL